MGYRRPTLLLAFEDPQYEGLEVRMKRLSLGDMFAVSELAEMGSDQNVVMENLDALITALAEGIISWNLEDERGDVIPIEKGAPGQMVDGKLTLATGIYALDIGLVMALVQTWIGALTDVAPPLPKPSNSGEPSPVEFELMEALSQSQSS